MLIGDLIDPLEENGRGPFTGILSRATENAGIDRTATVKVSIFPFGANRQLPVGVVTTPGLILAGW